MQHLRSRPVPHSLPGTDRWRAHWGEGDFPFLSVQLNPFMDIAPQPQENAWAMPREAQRLTAETVPNTAIAVITDLGDSHAIHPTPDNLRVY